MIQSEHNQPGAERAAPQFGTRLPGFCFASSTLIFHLRAKLSVSNSCLHIPASAKEEGEREGTIFPFFGA